MKNILLVEDDEIIIKGLLYLLKDKYNIVTATTMAEVKTKNLDSFDLLILDMTLPDGNTMTLLEANIKTPIIFLSANDFEEDIIRALDKAEDYITKPFKNKELLIRIKKVLDRNEKNLLIFKDIIIDFNKYMISVDEKKLDFTKLEYNIILLLFSNVDKVVTRDKILSLIWDSNNKFVNDNTLSVYIKRIREKLDRNYIKTIKGIGYMVVSND